MRTLMENGNLILMADTFASGYLISEKGNHLRLDTGEALALADAIYKAEGLGWKVFTAHSDVEVGLYDVTIEDLSHEIYVTRVATYNSSGRWTDEKTLSDLTLTVIAYRARPRPYEGEVE